MKWLITILASLLWPIATLAQVPLPTCWPSDIGGSGSRIFAGASTNGRWAWWWCSDGRAPHVVSTPKSLSNQNLGGRLDTIQNSLNPLQAAINSWRRNVLLPSTDPQFSEVMRDMRAHQECVRRKDLTCLF